MEMPKKWHTAGWQGDCLALGARAGVAPLAPAPPRNAAVRIHHHHIAIRLAARKLSPHTRRLARQPRTTADGSKHQFIQPEHVRDEKGDEGDDKR